MIELFLIFLAFCLVMLPVVRWMTNTRSTYTCPRMEPRITLEEELQAERDARYYALNQKH